MSADSQLAYDRKQWTVLGVQLSGVATAAIHPLLPLILLAGGSVTAFLLSHQQFLLILLVDIALFKPILLGTFPIFKTIDPTILLSLLLMISLAWQLFDRQTWRRLGEQRWILITFVIWVAWMMASTLYAPRIDWALLKSLRFAFFVPIIFLAPFILLKNEADNRRIVTMFLLVGLLGSLSIAIQTGLNIHNLAAGGWMGRQTILGTNPIAAARILTTCAAVAGAMVLKYGFKLQWVALFLGFLAAAILTGSRGPIVSLITALMVIGVALGPASRRRLAGTGLMIVLTVIVVIQILPEGFLNRFTSIAVTELSVSNRGISAMNTIDHRFKMWGMATDLWMSDARHMLVGEGSAGFGKLFPWRDFRYPHNLILEVLAEFGIIGLFVFLAHIIIGLGSIKRIKVRQYSDRMLFWLAGLLNFGASTMFSGDLNDNRVLWFFLAGLIATVKLEEHQNRQLT